MCLCYGNGLYDENAAKVYGAVGCPPIHTEEQRNAWRKYVSTLIKHYSGKITYYEVWNEPDGKWCWKHGVNAEELGRFTADTARCIKSADPAARVIGGAVCLRDISYINTALATGMGDEIDAISFHEYTHLDELVTERVESLRALGKLYNPDIEIIQGESGSQSRSDGAGALASGAWTETKQAKQLLRHAIMDIVSGVKFTSYFSCIDMIEALHGTVGDKSSYLDYGYFGILGADFDENGFSTGEYTPKKSYRALQTIASMLSDEFEVCEMPILFLRNTYSPRMFDREPLRPEFMTAGFKKPNGAKAFVYWYRAGLMTTDYEGTISMQVCGMGNDFKLIDMMDGSVYELCEGMVEDLGNGCFKLNNIPSKDYPLALVTPSFLD